MSAVFEISVASHDDVRLMGQWAADEGWNPGLNDRLAFTAADPGGFLIGRVDGVPAACLSVVRYGTGYGFLGFYIAREPFRGKGFGIRIWQAGMSRLAGRNVGLDGVVDQQANYRKSGFSSAWTNIRFAGVPAVAAPPDGVRLVDARSVPFDRLARYDRKFFPASRDSFLCCWLGIADRAGLVAVRDGEPVGFGVCRPSQTDFRVGPLYAESPGIAASLLSGLAGNRRVVTDVPDANPAAVKLLQEQGFEPQFETARMYTGPVPALDFDGYFAVTTLELG